VSQLFSSSHCGSFTGFFLSFSFCDSKREKKSAFVQRHGMEDKIATAPKDQPGPSLSARGCCPFPAKVALAHLLIAANLTSPINHVHASPAAENAQVVRFSPHFHLHALFTSFRP